MNSRATGDEYSYNNLQKIIGRLIIVPRRDKVQIINQLKDDTPKYGVALLQYHYGTFISLLRKSVPLKPMADFIVPITDASVITQARVDLCCDLFVEHSNSPSIGRILRKMSEHASKNIFVPPLGAQTIIQSRIPLKTLQSLTRDSFDQRIPPEGINNKASRISLKIYQELSSRNSDMEFAEALVEYLPLVWHSNRVLVGIEAWITTYLREIWPNVYNCEKTICLEIISSEYFRFWDLHRPADMKTRLLEPLEKAKSSAALLLIPYLWYLGSNAVPLMDRLVRKVRPSGSQFRNNETETLYMHIYQFYRLITHQTEQLIPMPSMAISDLLLRLRVYLLPCNGWAHEYSQVGTTLQGKFSVEMGEEGMEILESIFEDHLDIVYCLANSSWLGEIPKLIYQNMKEKNGEEEDHSILPRQIEVPTLITPQTLREDLELSYNQFCIAVVRFLDDIQNPITQYLLPQ